jgi:hypothetical protein
VIAGTLLQRRDQVERAGAGKGDDQHVRIGGSAKNIDDKRFQVVTTQIIGRG